MVASEPMAAKPSAASARAALLEVRNIAKSFGKNAVLRDISLQVAEGEFLTILGESGSGKTTLLRIIAGFEAATAGELWMAGQRLALARALVKRPQLLLLDEPLSALDANLRRQMQVELKSLQREVGISFVFVTHDQEEAMVMSDRIALLRLGELEQVATPREIYSRPATAYTAQFIGHTNLLQGEVRDGMVRCGSLSWRSNLPSGPVLLSLRPESIRMAGAGAGGNAVRCRGRLQQRAFHGATELLRIECADGLVFTVRTGTREDWQGPLEFEFDPEDAFPVRAPAERD